jgi:hypothetical protein
MDGECIFTADERDMEESLLHVQEGAHKYGGALCSKSNLPGYGRRMEFPFSTCKKELIKVSLMDVTEVDDECSSLEGAWKLSFSPHGAHKSAGYLRRWMVNAPHWTEEAWKFPFSTCKKDHRSIWKRRGVPTYLCKRELIKMLGTYEGGW